MQDYENQRRKNVQNKFINFVVEIVHCCWAETYLSRISHLFWASVWGKSFWNLSSGFSLKVSSNTIHLWKAHSPFAESQKSREYLLLAGLHRYSWIWERWKCYFSIVKLKWSAQMSSYALRTWAIQTCSTQPRKIRKK